MLPVEPTIRAEKPIIELDPITLPIPDKTPERPAVFPANTVNRSQSSLDTDYLIDDKKQVFNPLLNSLIRSPSLLRGGPQSDEHPITLPPEIITQYNLTLQNQNIHEILQRLLAKKQCLDGEVKNIPENTRSNSSAQLEGVLNGDRNVAANSADTIPSFLQYIGKELEKLPYESQEKAKNEIFNVILKLKNQPMYLMIPHHWQLPGKRP